MSDRAPAYRDPVLHFDALRLAVWVTTWMAMVGSRNQPREGVRGAQRTYRGGREGCYRGNPATLSCRALIGLLAAAVTWDTKS